MQHMALKLLGVVHQVTDKVGLLTDLKTQRIFDSLCRDQRMAYGADAAYPADDELDIVEMPFPDHRLEETGRLRHLPLAFFDSPVGDVDNYIAVAFDTGEMFDVYVYIFTHLLASVCFRIEPFCSSGHRR